MTKQSDSYAYPPRGLSRIDAARYIGVSATKFDQLVRLRQMPAPKRIGGRVIWDRLALEAAFSDLPGDENEIDRILSSQS
jgi:predicted DNA-binding transcriptional regulator AlpA